MRACGCGCGCVGVWVCGCVGVGVWVCGYVGVWVCGSHPSVPLVHAPTFVQAPNGRGEIDRRTLLGAREGSEGGSDNGRAVEVSGTGVAPGPHGLGGAVHASPTAGPAGGPTGYPYAVPAGAYPYPPGYGPQGPLGGPHMGACPTPQARDSCPCAGPCPSLLPSPSVGAVVPAIEVVGERIVARCVV